MARQIWSFPDVSRKAGQALRRLAAGVSLAALTATVAFAADPVAMVLDRSEGVNATAFAELMPGDEIALGTGGSVDLLDYTACREVRIIGGSVTATSSGLVIAEGEEKELRPGNCLKQEAGNAGTDGGKGLAVTMRGLIPENKVAASLMLRFGEDLKERYDSVFVSVDGGAPQEYKLDDKVLADMPDLVAPAEGKGNGVPIELTFKPRAGTGEAEIRQFTLDPLEVGRETAVVVVK
ncbi:MAG: hypothetical protein ACK4K8_00725 [Pannonibacter sp.]